MFSMNLLKSLKSSYSNKEPRRKQNRLDNLLKGLAVFLLSFYRVFLSSFFGLGGSCRFYPSCGDYALKVYKKHPFLRASRLTLTRLLKCHPLGPKIPDEEI